jgi:PAS domain S-box-containing protein
MERRIRQDVRQLKTMNETLEQRAAERSAAAEQRAADAARSEAALAEQTHILQSILDSMADGVVVVDNQGQFTLFNPAAERMLGGPPENMSPDRWPEHFGLFLPDRTTPYPAEHLPLVRAIRGEAVDRAEVFMRPGSGPAGIWLSTSARPLVDEKGEVRGGVAVFHNATRRKQAEEALQQSEALYQSLIDALPLHFFRKDLDGVFTFANQRFCDVLKLTLDDLLGKTDFDFYPVELAEKYLRDDHRVIDTGETFEDIEAHRKPSGELIHVQVLKAPVYDAQRNIIGIQGIFWEVTEHVRAKAATA